jgi:glycerophosphoryl diester phosphodiesterase
MRALALFCSLLLPLAVAAIALPAAPRKVIIAHRGASGYLPEHTVEAVAMAYAHGADFIEQDVVLSKDGVPVVIHDRQIDTVTDVASRFPGRARPDGRYYAIDFTLAELKQLRASERFDPKTGAAVFPKRFPVRQGSFSIPTFEQELQLIQGLNRSTGKNTGVYPEVKSPAWHRQEGQDISKVVLEVLGRYGYRTREDNFYLQCFDFEEVRRIRRELGFKGKLIQLLSEDTKEDPTVYSRLITREGLAEVAAVADGIGPSLKLIVTGRSGSELKVTDLAANAHALKLEIHPYTFRADALPEYASSLEELFTVFFERIKVDGAFTDHADRGVSFLRGLK